MHRNAKLAPRGRAEMVRRVVDQGLAVKVVAASFGVCEHTVRKWVKRHTTATGLEDLSSRPKLSPRRLPTETVKHHRGAAASTLDRGPHRCPPGPVARDAESLPPPGRS